MGQVPQLLQRVVLSGLQYSILEVFFKKHVLFL